MKTIKYILAALLIQYSLFFCHAQTDDANKKSRCNSYMRANYIFEGKLGSSKYITIKTGEHTYANYTSYLVVGKVIKGNMEKGTIELLQWAPGITYKGDDHMEGMGQPSEGMDRPPGQGLYFCWDTTETGKVSYFTNSNSKTLQFWDGIPVIDGKIKKDPRGGLSVDFSTLSEFYDYINANYGIKIDSAK